MSQLLRREGIIGRTDKFPISNFNRLMSSEPFRNRIGLSFSEGKVTYTHKKERVLQALRRIASDLMSKEVVLEDIWSNTDKNTYLDRLKDEKILPEAKDILIAKEVETPASQEKEITEVTERTQADESVSPKNSKRLSLIPKDLKIDYDASPDLRRIKAVVDELQNHLFLNKHINAIAVLFRVLIEMCMDYYDKQHDLRGRTDDKLHVKVQRVSSDLLQKGHIEKKYAESLSKFAQQEEIVSAHTFNAYTHSRDVSPSEQHLQSIWDTFQKLILLAISTKR